MNVELITCANSPQCLSTKMFLDLNEVEYEEVKIKHEEIEEMGFGMDDMPILFVNGELEMSGFDVLKIKELFGK